MTQLKYFRTNNILINIIIIKSKGMFTTVKTPQMFIFEHPKTQPKITH